MTTAAPSTSLAPGTRVLRVAGAEVGTAAADLVARFVADHPDGALGVATGSSPLGLYADLVRRRHEGLDASALTLFALDEYVGLAENDPRSYTAYVRSRIAEPLGIPIERVHVPRGTTLAEANAYEDEIAASGGVGLQIVGIGGNGHIGFNEPGSDRTSRTRIVDLAPSTRLDNAAHFDGNPSAVPARAMTQGLGTILSARRILLVARGAGKARALRSALTGPVTEDVPASLLQTHPDVVVVADPAALEAEG